MNMFSANYFNEKYKQSYSDAVDAKNAGDYELAGRHMKDAAYYLTKACEGDARKTQENQPRIDKMYAMADVLIKKSREMQKPAATRSSQSRAASGGQAETADGNSYFTFFSADSIDITFDDVIGLEDAKKAVREYVINPRLYPEQYNYKFIHNKGIMLEGPPGTGKTTFAKAVAKEINQPFALINVSELVDCYVGETSKHIDEVFAYLREYTAKNGCGVTVFFDEFDEIAKRRGGDDKSSEAAVPALLRNLDGVASNNDFLIIANTNCMDALDPAVLDRFRRRIYIPLPDADGRLRMFKSKTKDMEPQYLEKIDWNKAAQLSEGMSGRDITFICDDFKYSVASMKAGVTAQADINQTLENVIRMRRKS